MHTKVYTLDSGTWTRPPWWVNVEVAVAALLAKRMTTIGMKSARETLPEIVNDLKEHPDRVYNLMRYQESTAVILNRETFDALIDALDASDDLRDATTVLEREPLESFTEYHTRRLARRQSVTS